MTPVEEGGAEWLYLYSVPGPSGTLERDCIIFSVRLDKTLIVFPSFSVAEDSPGSRDG